METKPSHESTYAWVNLVRAQALLLREIEKDLSDQGLPPLSWYDVLWELRSSEKRALRPKEFETRLLLPQHGVSRLLDKLEAQGLVKRQTLEGDARSQVIKITPQGIRLQKKMWPVYAASMQRLIGEKLGAHEALQLSQLLAKLRN